MSKFGKLRKNAVKATVKQGFENAVRRELDKTIVNVTVARPAFVVSQETARRLEKSGWVVVR